MNLAHYRLPLYRGVHRSPGWESRAPTASDCGGYMGCLHRSPQPNIAWPLGTMNNVEWCHTRQPLMSVRRRVCYFNRCLGIGCSKSMLRVMWVFSVSCNYLAMFMCLIYIYIFVHICVNIFKLCIWLAGFSCLAPTSSSGGRNKPQI